MSANRVSISRSWSNQISQTSILDGECVDLFKLSFMSETLLSRCSRPDTRAVLTSEQRSRSRKSRSPGKPPPNSFKAPPLTAQPCPSGLWSSSDRPGSAMASPGGSSTEVLQPASAGAGHLQIGLTAKHHLGPPIGERCRNLGFKSCPFPMA